jgi:hypothetical protein
MACSVRQSSEARTPDLALGRGSYSPLYGIAGVCAVLGAGAIVPVKPVR